MGAISEGKLKALAVTSKQRFPVFPNVPTADEQGLKGFDVTGWFGIAAPGATPPAIVTKIHEAVVKALAEGQEVEIVVVQLDWERDRFTFSMKRRLSDPWDRVEGKYPAGSRHQGKVSRLAAFGAFVILEPGVDGLLHISHLGGGKKIRHPGEAVREGEELSVTVDSVDLAKRRISLSLAGEDIGEERDGPAADALRFPRADPPPIGTLGEALKAKLAEKRGKGKS